jgi:uracil-DNA glycosylase
VTNAAKHFKWKPRGKRRIHQKPNAREIAACRPWLEAELRIVKPKLVVLLGATAAQIFGSSFRVTREREYRNFVADVRGVKGGGRKINKERHSPLARHGKPPLLDVDLSIELGFLWRRAW